MYDYGIQITLQSGALQHVTSSHLPQLLQQLLITTQKKENVKAGTSKSLLSTNILRSHQSDAPERPPKLATLMSRKPGHPLMRQWGRGNPINAGELMEAGRKWLVRTDCYYDNSSLQFMKS